MWLFLSGRSLTYGFASVDTFVDSGSFTCSCSRSIAFSTTYAGNASVSVRPARAMLIPTARPYRSSSGPPHSSGFTLPSCERTSSKSSARWLSSVPPGVCVPAGTFVQSMLVPGWVTGSVMGWARVSG